MRSKTFRFAPRNIHQMQKCRNYQLSHRLLQYAPYQSHQTVNYTVSFVSSLHFVNGIDQVWHYGKLTGGVLHQLPQGTKSENRHEHYSYIF